MFRLTKIGNLLATFGFVVLFSLLAHANVEVSAGVDRNSLNPDDTLTYTITVSSSEDVTTGQPTLPAFHDFEVLNQWRTGGAKVSIVQTPDGDDHLVPVQETHYNYMLTPKRQGSLTIGAAQIEVGGKAFLTKPITIKVAPGAGASRANRAKPGRGARPGQPPAPPAGLFDDEEADDLFSQMLRGGAPLPRGGSRTLPINPNEAFFIQVETDKTEVFVGEQITVSFFLYTRGMIRDLDTLKYPNLKGFWKEDLDIATNLNFTQELVNGLPYKKALLVSYALFPIKEGVAEIDSYQAKCTVVPMVDQFGVGRPYVFTKASTPIKIKVKPLPTEGRPANFSGAVGEFQVTGRVEDNNIVTNQPFTFKIRFEGRGNAKLIDLPPFQAPEGMEIYDTQNDSKFFKTGTSYKDFSILLIPRREGEFTIPSVAVSIFDPGQKKYITRTTEPVRIHVGLGTAPNDNQALGLNAHAAPKSAEDGPPALETVYRNSHHLNSAQTLTGGSVYFLAIIAALLIYARKEFAWGEKKKDILRRLRARLKRVDAAIAKNDWRSVGREMTNTVYFVLGEVSGEGGANVELEKLLAKAPPSVRRELAGPLAKQMEVFQVLTFAPEGAVGNLKDPERLRQAVNEMTALMEKAVQLGVSAEQLDESASDPTTS